MCARKCRFAETVAVHDYTNPYQQSRVRFQVVAEKNAEEIENRLYKAR